MFELCGEEGEREAHKEIVSVLNGGYVDFDIVVVGRHNQPE